MSGPDSVVKYVVAAQADVTIDPHGLSVDRDVPLIPVDNLGKALTPGPGRPADRPRDDPGLPERPDQDAARQRRTSSGRPPTGYVVDSVAVDPVTVSVKGDAVASSRR